MTTRESYKECPLALNIARAKDYLLPCSERNFFDWMVIQQLHNGLEKAFHKSKQAIENGIGIRRRVTERIEKRFCAMGILQTKVAQNPYLQGSGMVSFYSVSFAKIQEQLPQIIDEESEYYKLFKEWFAVLAKEQTKAIQNGLNNM